MNLHDLETGIFEALYKGQLQAPASERDCPHCGKKIPEDKDGWAEWIQEIGIYLYEFTVRFKQKGLKFEQAKKKAWWGSLRRIRDERVAKIMSLRLPSEPKGLYTVKPEQICECGELKSEDYPKCPACAEKRYEEMNREKKNMD